MKLSNKVAIVTGAGGGIGRAIAQTFLAEGARVTAVDINPEALASLQAEAIVEQIGDRLSTIAADATDTANIAEVIRGTIARWDHIDILVNNVGGGIGDAAASGLIDESWDATMELNLTTSFAFTQAAAASMRAQKSGRIINISSSGGRYRSNTGTSNFAYAAAKGGVLQLTRTIAHALGPSGITVNAIGPGLVLTPAGKKERDELPVDIRDRVLRETPLGYFADPREIADVAVFLASDDASYVTGATILANGGWCTS